MSHLYICFLQSVTFDHPRQLWGGQSCVPSHCGPFDINDPIDINSNWRKWSLLSHSHWLSLCSSKTSINVLLPKHFCALSFPCLCMAWILFSGLSSNITSRKAFFWMPCPKPLPYIVHYTILLGLLHNTYHSLKSTCLLLYLCSDLPLPLKQKLSDSKDPDSSSALYVPSSKPYLAHRKCSTSSCWVN